MKWMNAIVEHVTGLLRKLFALKDTPHSIAGGVAIGVFIGFTPLFGVKTLLSLGLAYILRCNMMAAVIAVSLHDVFILFSPMLLRLEYDIGYWLMSHPHQHAPKLQMHHEHFKELLRMSTDVDALKHVGLPLLVGSLFIALPSAVVAYFLTLIVARGRAKEPEASPPA